MKFKYVGSKEGVFYGKKVEPQEEYNLNGELERLALKSSNFEKAGAIAPKKTIKRMVKEDD